MISRTVLCLLFLAVVSPAAAQTADEPPTSSERADDAPAVTAPSAPPPVTQLRDPRTPDDRPTPREQVFISPSGEPFRAALGQAYPVGQWFGRADTNRDGVLTAEEFKADHVSFFEALDADKDGAIDGFEAGAYEKTVAPEVAGETITPRRRRGGLFFGRRGPEPVDLRGAAYYGLINEPLPVRAADTNFDFKVTRAEALDAAARRFALLDLNKDSRVAYSELPPTRAQLRVGQPKG